MATLFFVTPTGSDSNNGTTIDTSFRTIQRAVEASTSSNDSPYWDATTIRVYPSASADAMYGEGIDSVSPFRRGLTFEAITGKGDVYIDGGGQTRVLRYGPNNTFRGFIVTGSTGTTSDDTIEYGASSYPGRIEDCVFDNCTATNRVVIYIGQASYQANSGDAWVKRCTLKNLDCTAGIYGPTKGTYDLESVLIYDCTFDYEAIKAYGNYNTSNNGAPETAKMGTVVENVTIDGCTAGRDLISLNERAFARNCIVSNCNLTSGDPYRLFRSTKTTASMTFPDGKTFFNCIAYNNQGTAGALFYPDEQTSSCFVDQDPGYTNRTGKDFSLSPTSIAVKAGTALASASFDINSASYTANSSPISIGAFQNPPVPSTITLNGGVFSFKGSKLSVQ